MARLCLVCDSSCVYFLIFVSLWTVYSAEGRYFYNVEGSHFNHLNEFVTINLNDGTHTLQKRHVVPLVSPDQAVPPPPEIVTEAGPDLNATEKINNKVDKLQKLNTFKNVTSVLDQLRKGLNATHKNETDEDRPPLVSRLVPQVSLDSNSVSKANGTVASDESDEDDYVDGDAERKIVDLEDMIKYRLKEFNEKYNVTSVRNDTHQYYNSSIMNGPNAGQPYWVEFENSTFTTNDLLSKSHRRAATVKLSFDFPFYGHLIRNITVATGGFIYTGDYVHSWLAATQYIAPLMANFDTSLSNESFIKYMDNSTAFTVQWENVSLQDRPLDGKFSFQATLHKSGDIVFVYQNVPLVIKKIQDVHHPVKIGLSDAYIMDNSEHYVRRKTIYEYHRINFQKDEIKNWTVIYLSALPTCLDNKDCETCLTNHVPSFQCSWCLLTKRCSTGLDRHYQDWVTKGCHNKQILNESKCQQTYHNYYDNDDFSYHNVDKETPFNSGRVLANSVSVLSNPSMQMGVSGIMTILIVVGLSAALTMWIIYAYRNPHTTSGQMLIRYRPSQWRWKRGEARYTAATIHM